MGFVKDGFVVDGFVADGEIYVLAAVARTALLVSVVTSAPLVILAVTVAPFVIVGVSEDEMVNPRLNQEGLVIRFAFRDQDGAIIDLDSATSLVMRLRKPSGTVVEKTLSVLGDPANGVAQYVTTDTDLNETGSWSRQAIIDLEGGLTPFEIFTFRVEPNL